MRRCVSVRIASSLRTRQIIILAVPVRLLPLSGPDYKKRMTVISGSLPTRIGGPQVPVPSDV